MEYIRIYTDGGAHNTGDLKGIGSWAFINPDDINELNDTIPVYAGFVADTTNNRTEMLSIINAVKSFPQHSHIHIFSDSGYVVKGYNHPAYLDKWSRNGWMSSGKTVVANIDLWQEILKLSYHYSLKFTLIRGHYKDPDPGNAFWNSIVDRACTEVMKSHRCEDIIYVFDFGRTDKSLKLRRKLDYDLSTRS